MRSEAGTRSTLPHASLASGQVEAGQRTPIADRDGKVLRALQEVLEELDSTDHSLSAIHVSTAIDLIKQGKATIE